MDTKRLLHENGKMLRRWMALFKSEELMVELEGRTGALERKALEPPQIRWSSESTTTQPSVGAHQIPRQQLWAGERCDSCLIKRESF